MVEKKVKMEAEEEGEEDVETSNSAVIDNTFNHERIKCE